MKISTALKTPRVGGAGHHPVQACHQSTGRQEWKTTHPNSRNGGGTGNSWKPISLERLVLRCWHPPSLGFLPARPCLRSSSILRGRK